jgi:hypothetical protein
MKILTAFGKESTWSLGYMTYKEDTNYKCISVVLLELMWNKKTKIWGIAIGIPFVASVGLFFQ